MKITRWMVYYHDESTRVFLTKKAALEFIKLYKGFAEMYKNKGTIVKLVGKTI